MTEAVETYVSNAEKMARKAIQAREDLYQGMREAQADFLRSPKGMHHPEDAKQRWMSSQKAKALIADNRWNMTQCIMYSVLALCRASMGMLAESKKQTKLLEEIRDGQIRSR